MYFIYNVQFYFSVEPRAVGLDAFKELLPAYGITHSMSRAGTPADNAAMEAINGWIKAEMFMDMNITGEHPVEQDINEYIVFFQ